MPCYHPALCSLEESRAGREKRIQCLAVSVSCFVSAQRSRDARPRVRARSCSPWPGRGCSRSASGCTRGMAARPSPSGRGDWAGASGPPAFDSHGVQRSRDEDLVPTNPKFTFGRLTVSCGRHVAKLRCLSSQGHWFPIPSSFTSPSCQGPGTPAPRGRRVFTLDLHVGFSGDASSAHVSSA